jgi:hypothetical protein
MEEEEVSPQPVSSIVMSRAAVSRADAVLYIRFII